MSKTINNIAIDLGASSGRLMLSEFDGKKIVISEIHRFVNESVRMNGVLYWDIFRLLHEMKIGLKKVAAKKISVTSLGIDTWGVDYGLLDKDGNLIGTPIAYRDNRTAHTMDEVGEIISLRNMYNKTGIQFMDFNTIFQLYSDKQVRPDIFEKGKDFLMMPDLFGYFFSGEKYNEYTILSTGQLLDARTKQLDYDTLEALGIKSDIFSKMVMPGDIVGSFTREIMEEVGLKDVKVIAVGSHDTASAVAATPFENENAAFLSCGTWSLLGVETKEPIISDESFQYNFTNEGGVDHTIRFLKNINGLYIMQELRKSYSHHVKEISFTDIVTEARKFGDTEFVIVPDDKIFSAPFNMMESIVTYCRKQKQGEPKELGELAMAVYNGLTKEYKTNIKTLEALTGKSLDCIHMIGGGIQDKLLCQLTAKATGKKIVAGPIEASALGNVIMQLIGLGVIKDLAEGREMIKGSFGQDVYL